MVCIRDLVNQSEPEARIALSKVENLIKHNNSAKDFRSLPFAKLTIDWTKIFAYFCSYYYWLKNGISPDYRFVLQNLRSFSERDIKPVDKVFDKKKNYE